MLEKRLKHFYSGRNASQYETARAKQRTWHTENMLVPELIKRHVTEGETIIDLPCGKGRWITTFNDLRLNAIMIDISHDMLQAARRNTSQFTDARFTFRHLDALSNSTQLPRADTLIMTRFLNLISLPKCSSLFDKALDSGVKKFIFTVRLRCGDSPILEQLKTHAHISIKNVATILNIRKKSIYHLYPRSDFWSLLKKKHLFLREEVHMQRIRDEVLIGACLGQEAGSGNRNTRPLNNPLDSS